MEKTTLYLPTELQAKLREAAKRTGRPQAEIVRDAVARYLEGQPRTWPKSIGAFPAPLDGKTPAEAKRFAREERAREIERVLGSKRDRADGR